MLDDLLDIEAVLKSPLEQLITLATNYNGYYESARDFIVNWIHPMLLKSKEATIKE